MKELIERQLPVVGVVVGSYESVVACENTIKTLQSLESIAENTGSAVVIAYKENRLNESRMIADQDVDLTVGCLSILASGQNLEMDYKDLENFIYFTRISGKPQLATLHMAANEDQLQRVTAPVSVASIYATPDRHHASVSADYVTVGYGDLSSLNEDELHFAITVNDIEQTFADIRKTVRQIKDDQQARVERDSLTNANEVQGSRSDDGLIL